MSCFRWLRILPMLGASLVVAWDVGHASDSAACGGRAEFALQILGSGGPELDGGSFGSTAARACWWTLAEGAGCDSVRRLRACRTWSCWP